MTALCLLVGLLGHLPTEVAVEPAAAAAAVPAALTSWESQWRGDDFGRVNALAVTAAGETLAVGEFSTNLTIVAGADAAAPRRLPSKPGPFGARTTSVLAKYGPKGELRFAVPVGGEHFASGVAATGDGGAVVVGAISNLHPEGDADAEGVAQRGDSDGFVARFDAAGQPMWLRRFAGRQEQMIRDVAVLPDGRLAIVGMLTGDAVFEGDPQRRVFASGASEREYELFVATMADDGALEWLHTFGGPTQDLVAGLAVGPTGSIAVTGECRRATKFRGRTRRATLRCREPHGSGFVALWSSAGELTWAKMMPGTAKDVHAPADVAVLADGGLVVVGAFAGNFGTGAGALVGEDPRFIDGFVARYDGRGELRWARHLRGPGIESARAVAAGPRGEVWVWGHASADMDFGDGRAYEKKVARGGENGLLLRYDAGGGLREASLVGGKPEPRGSSPVRGTDDVTEVRPEAIALAPDGGLRLAGSFSGATRLLAGEPALDSQGSLDGFVVALPPP